MSLFKKGKLGSKSGDDGAEEGANPDIEAQAEASAAADAEIAAAETQAETQAEAQAGAMTETPVGAGDMPPSSTGADLGKPELGAAGALDPAAGGGDDLSFDDGLGDGNFDDFDDDYVPQPAASKKKFLIATVGLIVLAGGSFALMNMMGGSDGPPPPPPPSQQVTQATPQDTAPPSLPGGNDAAPAGLPMPEPARNAGMGAGPDLALDDDDEVDDLPPLSPPGVPPQIATADAPPPMPMPMPTPAGDEYGAEDGGLDLPALPDMDEPDMADAGDMMSPPELPAMPPMGNDMGGDDMAAGDDMMSPPEFPMPPMDDGPDMAAGDDMMSPPDLPGMPAMDAGPDMSPPDLGGPEIGPDLGMPDLPMPDASDNADSGMSSPGAADLGMLDDLDRAMDGGAPPMPGADAGVPATGGMDALMGEEPSLAETLGADLAPMPVTGDEAMPPPSDDLAALMTAPDDGLDELNLLDELDEAGPADMGIAGAADDIVDTGRSRGRLNLDDLAVEQPLTPVFPRNTSKYLNVQKDYSSSSARAQVESAQRALKEGRDSLALELFDALYVKHPKDPRIMMGRAVALQKNGMVDEAVDAYEKVLKRDPRNVNALTNMLGLIRMTDPDKALTKLLDLKATYPGRPAILAQLGMTYADVGDEESAMRYLRMAQDLEPEDPRHAFNMAVLMDRRGYTPEAIMNYKRALFLNSNAGGNLVPTTAIQQRLDALR